MNQARAQAAPHDGPAEDAPGALRRLVRTAAGLLSARAEFASVELALARAQLMRWLLLSLLALLLGLLGLMCVTAFVALALWPVLGGAALLLPGLAYVAGGWWVVRRLMRDVDTAPPLLQETLQELAQDREALLQALAGEEATRAKAAPAAAAAAPATAPAQERA